MIVSGLDRPLHLHRLLLGSSSLALLGMLQCKATASGERGIATRQLIWQFHSADGDEKECKVYNRVLIKWLRFCYGEDISVTPDECGSAVAILFQLQLTCVDTIVPQFESQLVAATGANIQDSVSVLLSCAKYEECDGDRGRHPAVAVAKRLFSRENITKYEDQVVKGCLFYLPPSFLDYVAYIPHSVHSEFSLRYRYLKQHEDRLEEEDKIRVLKNCVFSRLNALK